MASNGFAQRQPKRLRELPDEAVGRFLAETTMADPRARVAGNLLWHVWVSWCLASSRATGAPQWFGRQLTLRGFRATGGSRVGLRLRDPADRRARSAVSDGAGS